MYSKVLVEFAGMTKVVEMNEGDKILNSLVENNIPINHSCGGNGTCGTCRILILKGTEKLSKPSELELEMIQERKFKHHERLSCQNFPVQGLEIKIP